jgi:hypothetical protein
MYGKFLTGVAAAFITFAPVTASAAAADQVLIGRLSGATELTQTGVAAVNFVQGHEFVPQRVDHVVRVSEAQAKEQAARYYGDTTAVTFGMLVLAAFAFIGVAMASRAASKGRVSDPPRPEGWREEVMRMLEADLTNFDGLKHRFSGH